MSNPENFLARFRSYSYHHILIACDNEAAASYIRNTKNLSIFRDVSIQQGLTIEDETKNIRRIDRRAEATGEVEQTRIGSYVVILNGMVDTQFVIQDVEWFTSTAASTDAHDRFTSIDVTGNMTIEEPRGIRFMNALNGASNLLESDPSGVIFMLKTVFVGHGLDSFGDEFTDHLVDLAPLEFQIYGVTGTFDNSGGTYNIKFASTNNGAARFPQYSRIAQQINLSPPGDDLSLNTSMQLLAQKMSDNSRDNRKCVIQALKDTYTDVVPSEFEQFRRVDYQIVMDEPYTESGTLFTHGFSTSNPLYEIDGLTDIEKDKVTTGGPFKFGPKVTVEQAIRHIMDRCSRVKKDRTEGDEGTKYSFKIHSEITMIGKGTTHPTTGIQTNEDIVLVVYRVRRFAEITNEVLQAVLDQPPGSQTNAGIGNDITPDAIKQNLIEFDYLFTGANTDIIDFDLKMAMGLAFLQSLSSTNNIGTGTNRIVGQLDKDNVKTITPAENAQADGAGEQPGEKPKTSLQIRSKTPIFPATNLNNVRERNIRGALDNQVYAGLLTKHAKLESVNVTMTIHGNPYIMAQSNRRDSERDRRSGANAGVDETRILQNWDYIPALAKINIIMPSTNETPSSQSNFETQRFWYDGFYYIYKIEHKFDGGQFTQVLHMSALPNESKILESQTADISECGLKEKSEGSEDSTQQTSSGGDAEPTAREVDAAQGRNRLNRVEEEGIR